MVERTYIAIDLKSFYASSECAELGFDALRTHLVVADQSRTDKTICLAVSPSLKEYGLPGRARLFEIKAKLKEVNATRRKAAPGGVLIGESYKADELEANPNLAAGVYIAKPRMSHYLAVSAKIYGIYLQYVAAQDIHVYSIDEVFMDVTGYLRAYGKGAHNLAKEIIQRIFDETTITATAGIGTNMYLAKVAMDIVAKHIPADADGVRIAQLDEMSYRRLLWNHRPLTDFWRVGRGYARKLEAQGLMTMGDIARCSVGRASDYYNEDLLYRMFGVNAELLIDHAWGWEPCEIADIRSYEPGAHSISSGQVLTGPADYATARLITKEMADALALDLVDKSVLTNRLTLAVGYDIGSLDSSKLDSCADYAMKRAAERAAKSYQGPVTIDRFGRKVPKSAVGSIGLGDFTSSSARIREAMTMLYERIVDSRLLVRRLTVIADDVATPEELAAGKRYEQLDLFGDDEAQSYGSDSTSEKDGEHDIQRALLDVKRKFGRNAVIKAMDMEDGATGQARNRQIGGHRA